jgi:hypothetical protein
MKNDLTTGAWQHDIGCPISITLFSTSDDDGGRHGSLGVVCVFYLPLKSGHKNQLKIKGQSLKLPYLAAGSEVKNIWDLHRNKKILPKTIAIIPTIG